MKLVTIRLDPINVARTAPAEVAFVADLKLAIVDLIAALRSMATEEHLKQIRDERTSQDARIHGHDEGISPDGWPGFRRSFYHYHGDARCRTRKCARQGHLLRC